MVAAPPTEAELRGYLDRPMTPPSAEVAAAIAGGPIDAGAALDRRALDRLLDPAPLEVETGWCMLPDGVAYAAVRTEMPGVTAEMVEWWFGWHPHDSLRYQIWFPGAHESTTYEPPRVTGAQPHWGAVVHPVEDIGLGMEPLRIAFLPPTRLGFSTDALDDPRVATIVGGLVGDDRRRVQHTLMVHVYLAAPDGLVLRSRFWMGAAIRPYGPALFANPVGRAINHRVVRRLFVPRRAPRIMAEHCAAEYAHLAALLPELHARWGVS